MRHSHNRPRVVLRSRGLILNVDRLEERQLLSTMSEVGPVALVPVSVQIMRPVSQITPLVSNPTPYSSSYTPSQIQTAYGFSKISFGGVKGDGTGQTIAIVDAYDSPTAQADLNVFDTQFGLPATTITRVSQTGTTTYPSTDSTGGWEGEVSLDVQWAHAIAPGATIMLVEAISANDNDLLTAVDYASTHANVVSMSWGGGEFNGETSYDTHFSHAGVAYVASSGDAGAPIEWPAASSNVVAVGGTALTIGSGNTYAGETGWSGSGGGPSAYVAQPSYQKGVVTQQTTMRANPDVAYDADPNTGFAVYDSFTNAGWQQYGGTSAGSPQWAALIAIADQGRALSSQPAINATSPQEILTDLYKGANTAEFHDITSGTSTGSPNYTASTGYDYVTGLGSPVANLVVGSLVGVVPSIDHLVLNGATSDTAGATYTVIITAQTSASATDAAYRGTVKFSSSDVQAGLPANYTFTAADAGSHTFTPDAQDRRNGVSLRRRHEQRQRLGHPFRGRREPGRREPVHLLGPLVVDHGRHVGDGHRHGSRCFRQSRDWLRRHGHVHEHRHRRDLARFVYLHDGRPRCPHLWPDLQHGRHAVGHGVDIGVLRHPVGYLGRPGRADQPDRQGHLDLAD